MDTEKTLCPSSRCEEGAILLGVISENGSVLFAREKVVVDKEFVTSAKEGRSPEKRFRFSNDCVKCGCKQWTGNHCSVIEKVLATVPQPTPTDTASLPQCSIREQCRWFFQKGPAACRICPLVITDLREDLEAV